MLKKNNLLKIPWICESCLLNKVASSGYSLCDMCYNNFRKTWDYRFLCNIDSSKEYREKFIIWDVFLNSAKCKKCGDEIISKYSHNFVTCKCWSVSVDWWSWYARRVWHRDDYEELSVWFNDIMLQDIKNNHIDNYDNFIENITIDDVSKMTYKQFVQWRNKYKKTYN